MCSGAAAGGSVDAGGAETGSGATGEGGDALLSLVEEPSPVTRGPKGLELAVVEAPQVRALGRAHRLRAHGLRAHGLCERARCA